MAPRAAADWSAVFRVVWLKDVTNRQRGTSTEGPEFGDRPNLIRIAHFEQVAAT